MKMNERTVKFAETAKPPYNGRIKQPNRIADVPGDLWYIVAETGAKEGPYTTVQMRVLYEARLLTPYTLCSNEGIYGNYYSLNLLFYPNIQDAFLPDEYNPLVGLEHRTAAALADIDRIAGKRAWNEAANNTIISLPNTDTDPVEGDDELKWFLRSTWVDKNGEPITFGENVRRDFIMIGEEGTITMYEFRNLDPSKYAHRGDGIYRINVKELRTTVCAREVMLFILNGITHRLYPVIHGSKRYLIECNGIEVEIFAAGAAAPRTPPARYVEDAGAAVCGGCRASFADVACGCAAYGRAASKTSSLPPHAPCSVGYDDEEFADEDSDSDDECLCKYFRDDDDYKCCACGVPGNKSLADARPFPSYIEISEMKRYQASDLLGFNDDQESPLLKVIDDNMSIPVILTRGRHWRMTNWMDNRQICIRFMADGYIRHESDEIAGTWSIQNTASFALYQDNRDWTKIYKKKLQYRIRVELQGAATPATPLNMYVLYDMTSGVFYLQEELAYFQIIAIKVMMADIGRRVACEAVQVM